MVLPQSTGSKALSLRAQSVSTVAVTGQLEVISAPPGGPIKLYFVLRAEIFGRVEFINMISIINPRVELAGLSSRDLVRAAEVATLSAILRQVTPPSCGGSC